jgi:H+/Cl- antiporter ClcA
MFFIIILGVWYSIIGSLIFTYNWQSKPEPSNYWLWIDRYVLFALGGLYILAHIILIIWFIIVPFGLRRQMRNKDLTYHELLLRYNYQHLQSIVSCSSESDYRI